MKHLGWVIVLALTAVGCSQEQQAGTTEADCSSQVRFQGVKYTSYGYTDRDATRHAVVDKAECHDEGKDAPGSVFPENPKRVAAWRFEGYAPNQVLGVRFDEDRFAVHVADSVPRSESERIFKALAKSTENSPVSGPRDKRVAPERVLDPLTMTLVLGKPRGDRLPARIRTQNQSGQTVLDPGCRVNANYSFGVVPVSKPGARLTGRMETYCMGKRKIPDGFTQTGDQQFSLRGLPPGKYLAVIDFGNARTERLKARFNLRSR